MRKKSSQFEGIIIRLAHLSNGCTRDVIQVDQTTNSWTETSQALKGLQILQWYLKGIQGCEKCTERADQLEYVRWFCSCISSWVSNLFRESPAVQRHDWPVSRGRSIQRNGGGPYFLCSILTPRQQIMQYHCAIIIIAILCTTPQRLQVGPTRSPTPSPCSYLAVQWSSRAHWDHCGEQRTLDLQVLRSLIIGLPENRQLGGTRTSSSTWITHDNPANKDYPKFQLGLVLEYPKIRNLSRMKSIRSESW